MKPLHLKFESEQQANAVLFDAVENQDVLDEDGKPVVDLIGKWRNISVIGPIFVNGEQIAGWHVNVLLMDDEDGVPLESFMINVKSPVMVWAGATGLDFPYQRKVARDGVGWHRVMVT